MSFGYFQGEEDRALAYYKKLLESEADPKARKELEEIIAQLEKIVSQNHPLMPANDPPTQNSCAA
jgi:hypothetical protein